MSSGDEDSYSAKRVKWGDNIPSHVHLSGDSTLSTDKQIDQIRVRANDIINISYIANVSLFNIVLSKVCFSI